MKKVSGILMGFLSLWAGFSAGSAEAGASDPRDALRKEEVHFLECLAFVYDPALWFSFEGNLYFQPHTEFQVSRLAAMKEARNRYAALTNRWDRYQLATRAVARSGITAPWRQKVLLPYSTTQPDLTPTRDLSVRAWPKFEVVQKLSGGDALLRVAGSNCFVVDFGRAMSDSHGTNALLVRLGTKSLKAASGNYLTMEALADVGLNIEEFEVLQRIAKACADEAATLMAIPALSSEPLAATPSRVPEPVAAPLTEEFEIHKRRARDDSPYMQFLLAKDYLEGLGTPKDIKLGWEWMRRAAANGGGDAKAYLRSNEAKQR